MNTPLVSIAVLTYNHEKFIIQALESFLRQQTTFDFEIVIGDDASTDDTKNILKKFENEYPEKFCVTIQDSNIGMIPNFINTIQRCRGKYIAFCEGDDFWIESDKLQVQVDFLESNPNYGICFHDAQIYDDTLQMLKPDDITKSDKTDYDLDDLVIENFMHTPTVVLRNDFKLPEDFVTLPIGDWPLYLLMLNQRKIKKIKRVMAVYRIHNQSAWSSKSMTYRLDKTIFTLKYILKTVDLTPSQRTSLEHSLKQYTKSFTRLNSSLLERIKLKFLCLKKTHDN